MKRSREPEFDFCKKYELLFQKNLPVDAASHSGAPCHTEGALLRSRAFAAVRCNSRESELPIRTLTCEIFSQTWHKNRVSRPLKGFRWRQGNLGHPGAREQCLHAKSYRSPDLFHAILFSHHLWSQHWEIFRTKPLWICAGCISTDFRGRTYGC